MRVKEVKNLLFGFLIEDKLLKGGVEQVVSCV
jgi:hypothetical protein